MAEPIEINATTPDGTAYLGWYYLADDYDAIKERLTQAEALLRESVDVTKNWDGIADRIDAFLVATVSAPAAFCVNCGRTHVGAGDAVACQSVSAPAAQPCGCHTWTNGLGETGITKCYLHRSVFDVDSAGVQR